MTRIITVASGKGGVGKTTAVTNLGAALTRMGYEVVIIDASLKTSNLGLHLGMDFVPVTLQDVLRGDANYEEAVYHHPVGFDVIPADLGMEAVEREFGTGIEETIVDLVGKTDLILVDAPAGLGTEAKKAILAGDELLIITIPYMPAATDALKTSEFVVSGRKTRLLGIIVNMVEGEDYEMSIDNLKNFMGHKILGKIPYDDRVKKSVSKRVPVSVLYPDSEVAVAFRKLAAELVGKEYEKIERKKGIIEKIRSLLGI